MSRFFGATSVTSRSPMTIAPSFTSSSPAIQRSSVVFPQPDGPTSTMNSPSRIVRSTPSTARTPLGKVFTTVWSSIAAMPVSFAPRPRSAFQSGGDDPAREPLLQGEEGEQRRDREEQRTRELHRHQRELLSRVVIPSGDLHAEGREPVGQEQRGVDVLGPPAGAEDDDGHRERADRVRKIDLDERPQVARAVDRRSVVEFAGEARVELTEEEDQEGIAADPPDHPRPARRVHPEFHHHPEEGDEAHGERDERRREHEDEQDIASWGAHSREGVACERAREHRGRRPEEGQHDRVPEVVREREVARPRVVVVVPVRRARDDGSADTRVHLPERAEEAPEDRSDEDGREHEDHRVQEHPSRKARGPPAPAPARAGPNCLCRYRALRHLPYCPRALKTQKRPLQKTSAVTITSSKTKIQAIAAP